MEHDTITIKSSKVNEYLHHIDVKAYGTTRMLSVFIGEFDDNSSILIDCGSSLDIKKSLKYIKKNKIPLSSFKYLITTHHHFDHNGGLWKLYEELKKYNPNVKILTNQITKELLNDYELHLKRGSSTYGNLVGVMKPIEEKAFKIITPSSILNFNPNMLDIIDTFTINRSELNLVIFKTAGHTPDHQCPALIKNGKVDFIQYGESLGTLYHSSELITMPTSMPIYYNHNKYMESLENLKKINPLKAGFGHFGVVNGKENVKKLLLEHESFMKIFRERIIKYYNEKPETRYVLNRIFPLLTSRTDLSVDDNPVFNGIVLAIVYGMMISLGYREIPPDELIYYKKYYSL